MPILGYSAVVEGVQQAGLIGVLNEMLAFEQACGCRPEETFYHYEIDSKQMHLMNQYRLIVKNLDGRVCLSRLGRSVAAAH